MGRAISPAGSGGLVNSPLPAMGGTSPLGQPLGTLGPGSMRPGMGAPSMAAIAAMSGNHNANHGMGMKMPRFMQHSMLQQQSIFGGMDPRMMMMMGRNMHNPAAAAMMRGHLQPFRPRFM
ncbi:UNVERIFIED_CONTAM: hypothetical protein RMT77_000964 [Armadillidium vulgare]